MKKLSTLCLLLLVVSSVWAVPALQVKKLFTQPDGSTVTIVLQGDERFSYYSTIDGIMLQKTADGYMKYATVDVNGVVVAGCYAAKDPSDRSDKEIDYISTLSRMKIMNSVQKQISQRALTELPSPVSGTAIPSKGPVKGLVILAEFPDVKFTEVGTLEEFNKMMNEEGYSNYDATGSARDYFIAQSNGVFTPSFDVVGPVTLPKEVAFYGEKTFNQNDRDPAQMIVDACNLVKEQFKTDFSQYDFDNNGKVDLVYVIYAGHNQAQGGGDDTIWPHNSQIILWGKDLKLDGKIIDNYACSSELRGPNGMNIEGVGTFCHEFSHCLGLPDLYNSRGGTNHGMYTWSIMDQGCYNNNSKTPPNYSAFERASVGWLTLEELKAGTDITLEELTKSNKGYVISSDYNPDEFFVLENRHQVGWDAYLANHGLLITHIDYDSNAWIKNTVNAYTPARWEIVPADDEFGNTKNDLYPGIGKYVNRMLSDGSQPDASLHDGHFLGKPISNIKEKNGVISFDFMQPLAYTPVAREGKNITPEGFTACWDAARDAEFYSLYVAPCTTRELVLGEDFSKFVLGEENISDKINEYTSTEGWEATEAYGVKGGCMIGKDDAEGYLITPEISLANNNVFTIRIGIKGSKSVANGLELSIINEDVITDQRSFYLYKDLKDIYWIVTTNSDKGKIKIKTSVPSIINDLVVYNGNLEEALKNGETMVPENTGEIMKFENLTSTSHPVTGLKEKTKYVYYLYAHNQGVKSDVSNKIIVATVDDSIESAQLQANVRADKNSIVIFAEEGQTVQIYTIDGMLKQNLVTNAGENKVSVENGIYIVRMGNASAKVIVSGK